MSFWKQEQMKFITDWDVPRPNPLSTLISARLDFKKCQDKLKSQINDSDTIKKDINDLSQELYNKQNILKTLHLEFEKLESEDKKTRAREKLEEERKLQIKLNEQFNNVKEKVEALVNVKEKMERYLSQYRKFESYLAYVALHDKQFTNMDDILERYRVLCNMQTELRQSLESDLQFMIQSRNDADDLTEEKCNAINLLCNRLAKVRARAKKTSEDLRYWESLVAMVKTFIAEKTLEQEMVKAATWSLYLQMCQQHKIKDPVSKNNFEKQISFIYKTIVQFKQIVDIARQKSGETFQSNRPNSSVASVKRP